MITVIKAIILNTLRVSGLGFTVLLDGGTLVTRWVLEVWDCRALSFGDGPMRAKDRGLENT